MKIPLTPERFSEILQEKQNIRNLGSDSFDTIPIEMKERKQWIGYVYPSKNPISPKTMSNANVTDPSSWSEFDEAVASIGKPCQYYNGKETVSGTIAGIGFVVTDEDPFVVVDLDHVLNGRKQLTPEAQDIFDIMDSYTEISPSGTGLHIFAYGSKPGKECKVKISDKVGFEMYEGKRYFTMTGNVYKNKLKIGDRESEIREVYTKYFVKTQERPSTAPGSTTKGDSILDDEILLNKARTSGDASEMFIKLFDRGDMSDFNDDHSSADNALVGILAFWSRNDVAQIDRLFRRSQLMRDKWDRATAGSTYGRITIEKVISRPHNIYSGKPGRLPSVIGETKETQDKKEEFIDIDILRDYLQEQEITIRLNELTNESEITGLPKKYKGYEVTTLPVILTDTLKKKYKGVTRRTIEDILSVLQVENKFNPVTDYLDGLTWDHKDYLSEVYNILGVTDPFDKTLVRKWFIQCVALAYNDETHPVGADGVLVLQGLQGSGKTSFFRELVPKREWFREGIDLDMKDKDSVIRAVGVWIAELGELDSTLKREQASLKAFVTNYEDNIRFPYAQQATKKVRITSFCATVNEESFLRDKTGARRWWVIKIKDADIMSRVVEFSKKKSNITGLWSQLVALYRQNPNGFRLTVSERQQLNDRNFESVVETPTETLFLDYLNFDAPDDQWDWWTASELKQYGYFSTPLQYTSANEIGKAVSTLEKRFSNVKRKRGRQAREFYIPLKNTIRRK